MKTNISNVLEIEKKIILLMHEFHKIDKWTINLTIDLPLLRVKIHYNWNV